MAAGRSARCWTGAGAPGGRAALLARLAELGALRLDLEGPVDAWPERLLREKLELIADPGGRAAALAPVDQMIRARDAVAATAGDPAGLQRALAGLAETFEQVTGSAATRRAGANYAGRTLVYHRCGPGRAGGAGRGGDPGAGGAARPGAGQRPLAGQRHHRQVPGAVRGPARPRERPGRRRARAAAAAAHRGVALPVTARGRGVGELAAASVAELQRRWQQVLGPPSSARRHQVSADAISARAAECFPGAPGRLERRPAALTGHHDRGGLSRRGGARQLPARPRRDTPGH